METFKAILKRETDSLRKREKTNGSDPFAKFRTAVERALSVLEKDFEGANVELGKNGHLIGRKRRSVTAKAKTKQATTKARTKQATTDYPKTGRILRKGLREFAKKNSLTRTVKALKKILPKTVSATRVAREVLKLYNITKGLDELYARIDVQLIGEGLDPNTLSATQASKVRKIVEFLGTDIEKKMKG